MKDIAGLLLNNFTTICLVLGFGIITVTNKSLNERTNHFFILFDLLVLALIAADITESYFSEFSQPSLLRYVASAVSYTLRPASIAILIGILLRRKKSGIALWIAVVTVGVLAFTSYFTHIMFWYGEQNYFMRGPLSYISHILSGIFLVILVVLTLKMHRNISSVETFAVLYSAAICVVATTLESVLSGYKFLLTGAMMTSCALYYVVLYIETYRRDPLTGLMNRRSFYSDARRLRCRPLAVVSFDLNGLKQINDTFGHGAGDRALQCVGKTMLERSTKKWLPYRVGGDEFVALGKEQTVETVERYVENMRADLEEDQLTGAFGFAFYQPGDDFDHICNQADSLMYSDKNRVKHRDGLRRENGENIPHMTK